VYKELFKNKLITMAGSELVKSTTSSYLSVDLNHDKMLSTQDTGSFHSAMESIISSNIDENSNVPAQTKLIVEMLERTASQLRKKLKLFDGAEFKEEKEKQIKRRIPTKVTENIFIITVVWQLLCVGALELVDALDRKFEKKNPTIFVVGVVIMVIFQISNLVLSFSVSVKLTKQYMHQTATMKFLLQSYLSTLFLFGGLYTSIGRLRPDWFDNLTGHRNDRVYALELFSQLLFTSISTGTLCGAASVTAVHPVTEIMMSLQMMLSFVYFASILSQVINPSLAPSSKSSGSDKSHSLSYRRFRPSKRNTRSRSRSPRIQNFVKDNYGTIPSAEVV